MKYMILIHSNPQSREIWESFSEAQRGEGYAEYAALANDLAASGELIVAEALADPSMGQRIPALAGSASAGSALAGSASAGSAVATSDGPFAEAKEHLAGFFLVETESLERALEIATRIPEADLGLVEVRPILDMNGTEY